MDKSLYFALRAARDFIAALRVRKMGELHSIEAVVILKKIDDALDGWECGHGYLKGLCLNPECLSYQSNTQINSCRFDSPEDESI